MNSITDQNIIEIKETLQNAQNELKQLRPLLVTVDKKRKQVEATRSIIKNSSTEPKKRREYEDILLGLIKELEVLEAKMYEAKNSAIHLTQIAQPYWEPLTLEIMLESITKQYAEKWEDCVFYYNKYIDKIPKSKPVMPDSLKKGLLGGLGLLFVFWSGFGSYLSHPETNIDLSIRTVFIVSIICFFVGFLWILGVRNAWDKGLLLFPIVIITVGAVFVIAILIQDDGDWTDIFMYISKRIKYKRYERRLKKANLGVM